MPRPHTKPPAATPSRPPPLGDHARDIAIRALARQMRTWPDLAPDAIDQQIEAASAEPAPGPPSPLDLSLARAIYTAAIQHALTLAHLLNRDIRQGFEALEPRARAVLLAGAAQIVFLDRIPAHAAINHAVEWAKTVIRPGAGGLMNAVLRRIADFRASATVEPGPWTSGPDALPLGSGQVLRSATLALPDDPLTRLSIAASHPLHLLQSWSTRWSPAQVQALALHSLVQPPVILNTESAPTRSAALESATVPHAQPHHRVFTGEPAALGSLLAAHPGVWVQDPSSAGAVRSIADLRPAFIVDLCAGQGTKTRQLAAAFPGSAIIATDVDKARFTTLRAAFASSTQVTVLPFPAARDQSLGRADLVVLDVPCSNTGVLSRRPEARYRFSPAAIESLTATQRQIIADTIPLLTAAPSGRPKGRILYATCSLEPQENTDLAAWASKWHGFRPARTREVLPAGLPGQEPASYHDGAYSVLLEPS